MNATMKEIIILRDTVHSHPHSGFVLPMAVVLMLVLAVLAVFLNTMGSGLTNQVQHVDEAFRCKAIADSVYSKVLAQIRNKPYHQRFYAGSPYIERGVSLMDGTYDLLVIDVPASGEGVTDLYVRAIFGRAKQLFIWRFKNENSILEAVGRLSQVLYTSVDRDLPASVTESPYGAYIDAIIEKRKENKPPAQDKTELVQITPGLKDLIDITGGNPEDIVDAIDPVPIPEIPPGELPDPPPSPRTVIFEEDFELCPVGEHPNSFTMAYSGDAVQTKVVDPATQPKARSKAFQVAGRVSYSRVENYQVGTGTRLTYQFDACMIRAQGPLVGMATFEPLEGTGGNFLNFSGNGSIRFCGDWGGGGTEVGNWTPNSWHTYRVEVDMEARKAAIYIDGTLAKENVEASKFCNTNPPKLYDAFNVNSGHSPAEEGNLFLLDNIILSR